MTLLTNPQIVSKAKFKEEAPAAAKPNPLNLALDTICGLVNKVIGLVMCIVSHVIGLITLVKDKILGLPWDCIINLITTLALIGGTTFAFWSLTEDNAVLAIPVLQLVGPFLLTKIQEKTWLDAKQVHLGNELLTTAVLGIKYYTFRTYITGA